jgi:adenylosuccinate synthase
LEIARKELIKRDMAKDMFIYHERIYSDLSYGVLFEGAQALGLHAWLGTRPDVTSSDTSMDGIKTGTAFWRGQDILDRIGVFKIPYTSSVGARKMPTHIELPRNLADLTANATDDQKWAAYIRETAHEYGTTSGRPRDILHLDLEMIRYNCRMAGIEVLAGTHLDIAREKETIKVCTHYTNDLGERVPYQPGLRYQNGVIPHYIELPGWNGDAVAKARSIEELPDNARYFLAFIQGTTGYPIVAGTTGPARENFISVLDRKIE